LFVVSAINFLPKDTIVLVFSTHCTISRTEWKIHQWSRPPAHTADHAGVQASRRTGHPSTHRPAANKQATRSGHRAGHQIRPPDQATGQATGQATRKGWPYYIRDCTGGTNTAYIVGPPLAGGLRRARTALS